MNGLPNLSLGLNIFLLFTSDDLQPQKL